jgi:hypothetical protein
MLKFLITLLLLSCSSVYAADGVFTNLRATNARFTNISTQNGKFHGTSTGTFSGTIEGNVTGEVTGTLTGNVIGNVTGNVTGNLIGSTVGTCYVPETFSTLSSAQASPSCASKTIVVTSPIDCGNLTISADRSVEIKKGGKIRYSGNLVINGPFHAGLFNCLEKVGSGTITFGGFSLKEVPPEWWNASGDGTADDTAAIQSAIYSGARSIVFYGSMYDTTGVVIPADSPVGELRGVGRPTIKRHGQGVVATGLNLTMIAVYKAKLKIHGFTIDGQGQSFAVPAPSSTVPPDRTWYADIAALTAVGSGDVTLSTDNMLIIEDVYFKDAPGSSVAGSQSQSVMVSKCKFDGWNDHAIYYSGSTAQSMDNLISTCIFRQTRYNGGFAVKIRNRMSRWVVSTNTFNLGSNGAIAVDQGNAAGSHYIPTGVSITGNTADCGIFLTMNCNFTVENPTDFNSVVMTANTVRSVSNPFYFAETVNDAWAAHIQINGNTFINKSGGWKTLFTLRYINTTYDNSIEFQDNRCHDYGLMEIGSNWPKSMRVINNKFNGVYSGVFIYPIGTDDITPKYFEYRGNRFTCDTYTGSGTFRVACGGESTVIIEDNYNKNINSICELSTTPTLVSVKNNKLIDSTGITFSSAFFALTPRETVGQMFLERNKSISTVGASAVPRLMSETVNTPKHSVLESYNIYTVENYFNDVTYGFYASGTAVTGYAGANKIYGINNYGIGSSESVAYPPGSKAAILPVMPL